MHIPPKRLNIIGCGHVGQTLARLWFLHDCVQIGDILNTSLASSQAATGFIGAGRAVAELEAMQPAEIHLLGCPDKELERCGAALAGSGLLRPGDVVFHCSGALSSRLLQPAHLYGAWVASVHPVKSFAEVDRAVASFSPTFCGVEGDPLAEVVLSPLFAAIGGIPFAIDPSKKTLYHAASVLACNYLVALQELSIQTFTEAGVGRELAMQILQPIVQETVSNVFALGTAQALTGPIARGDYPVVGRQLAALQAWQPAAGELYRLLGQQALALAGQRGKANPADLMQVSALLAGTPSGDALSHRPNPVIHP